MTDPLSTVDPNSLEGNSKNNEKLDKNHSVKPSDPQSQPTAQGSTSSLDRPPLMVPLQTLSQTLEGGCDCITTHDLIEAYSLLYIRIRALAAVDSSPFSIQAPMLIQCLRRDIYEGLSLFSAPQAPSIGLSSWDISIFEEHELQGSVDSSQLCQAALLVTGLLLSLPWSLTDSQRSALLEPVIDVCSQRHLSVFNADKIRAQALLCLRAYKVLQHISGSQLKELIKGFEISFDRDNGEVAKVHAFKTIQYILIEDPSRFLEPLSTLFPKVLVYLTSIPCRMEACSTLCGFALAKLAVISAVPQLLGTMSGEVNGFLDHHGSRSRTGSQQDYMLPSILQQAHQSGDSVWALVTLATLIVLADSQLFSRPRSFRLIFDTLRHSSKHRKPVVRSLHTEVWKCLVWAMSRIIDDTDTLARASRVLGQDLTPGIGSRIIGALLAHQDEVLVPEAISILKALIDHPQDSMLHEGVLLLNRLISGVGTSDDYTVIDAGPFDYLSHGLVDGTWLRLNMAELQERLCTETPPFPITSIRSLTEAEIVANWQELSEFWALAVEKLQKSMTAEQLTMLTGIWQALLLSQAHLTQGQSHLTASTTFGTKLATLITRFLTPGEADPETRLTQLSLVKNWWRVLRNVFHNPTPSSLPSSQPASWLSIPAEIVLSGIMEQRELCLKNPSVKTLWSEICSELVDAGAPTLLHVLHTRITTPPLASDEAEEDERMTVTRQLWLILGSHYLQRSDDVCWTSFSAFLSLPFHCDAWVLEHEDSDTWRRVFEGMLLNARNDGVDDDKAIESLQAHVGEDAYRRDLIFLRTFETCVALSETLICRKSLAMVNETLSRLYGAAYGAEKNVALALKLMHALGNLWDLEEASELVSSLLVVQDSVAMWLEDRNELAQGEERIEMVEAVYVSSLRALGRHLDDSTASNHDPDLQTLCKIEKLITSAFNSPTPNIAAPQAFMELWRAHFLHRFSLSVCPEWLVTCVKLVGDLFGDRSIGEEASLGTSSPSTVISDSQKSPVNLAAATTPSKALDREYSKFADLADAVGFGFQVGRSERKEKTPTRQEPQDSVTPKASAFPLPWSPNAPNTRPRAPKRHLTEADLPHAGRNWADGESLEEPRPLKRTKTIAGPSTLPPSSSPIGPTSSPLALADSRRKRGKQTGRDSPLPPSSDVDDDDYDTWEAAVSRKDIQDIQQELGQEGDIELVDEDEQEEDGDEQGEGDENEILLSPTFSEFPLRSRRRERSQTAPELELDDSTSPSAHPIPKAEPLRRHYSSSSAQLDALQQAYAMVVETDGVSQLPVEDLLKLKRLTSRIGETVDEQIYQQLEREDDDHAEGHPGGRRIVRRRKTRGSSMAPD